MTESGKGYNKATLDNGVRLVTEHIPTVRSVAIGVWVMAGSRYETLEQSGISHFLEHMVFKGTARRTSYDIAHDLESVGGMINAFTGKELTCYYARLLDEHLPVAVDVLSDIVLNSVYDPEELNKEKQVIIEEINSMEDTPDDWIHDLYARNLYPGHALGMSILGTRDIISNMSREQMTGYLDTMYSAPRVVISAAGNLEHDELLKMVEKQFTFKGRDKSADTAFRPVPGKRTEVVKKNILQSHVCIGNPGLPYGHPDRYKLSLMNTILGSGMSSRLFQNIREKTGMAYSVYSYLDFYKDTGAFASYIATDPDKTRQAVQLVLKEYRNLAEEKVSTDELEKCKSQLKGSLLLGLESTNNRMTHLARTEIYLKRFITLDEIIEGIDKVTAPDVQNTASRVLDENSLCMSVLSPLETNSFTVDDLTY